MVLSSVANPEIEIIFAVRSICLLVSELTPTTGSLNSIAREGRCEECDSWPRNWLTQSAE